MSAPDFSGCDEKLVLAVQNSIFLHASELLMLILSFISVPILVATLRKIIKDSYFHRNIKMIIAVHCFSILLHCIGRVVQHSSDLYLWLAPLPVCDKRQFFGICVVSRSLFSFGVYCSSFTTVFIAIERTIATHLSRKYENGKSKYGVLLVVSQTLRATGAVTNLSQKYQIEENKTLIPILLSFTSLDFVFMVIYFLSLLIVDMLRLEKSDSTYFGLFELIQCVPVYAIVVILVMSRVIKRIHHKKTVKLNAEVQVKDEAYFIYLKQQWSHFK
ncbi:hypothetical protein CRE_09472 [Caenorhabditis remanei]|uniref:Uncharacterized protein n=1 Tax=Caenorhabditis remanei TaxID=31234 RepID=E3LJ41_CAERE|nr:hypothetical protein CRE_09472 [Caenorhabditis remanei]